MILMKKIMKYKKYWNRSMKMISCNTGLDGRAASLMRIHENPQNISITLPTSSKPFIYYLLSTTIHPYSLLQLLLQTSQLGSHSFNYKAISIKTSENPNWTKTYKVSHCNLVLHVQYTCCISHFHHS